jgi:hypothetical protein
LTAAAGLDLKRELKDRIREWRYRERVRTSRLIILLSLPKQRRPGGPVEDADHFAVACFDTVMEVALKLGEWRLNTSAKKTKRRRDKRVPKLPKEGDPISVFLLRPVFGLTPSRAAKLCGDQPRAIARRVAVGSGALGSQVLLNMARAGYAGWEVIDDDRLFPHNLQRHALDGISIGYAKANGLAFLMNSLFDGSPVAVSIPANLLYPGADEGRVRQALTEANTILDISASVAVARHLAWLEDFKGRSASLFLNPGGTDLVLLAEDASRTISLDSLEMQYYRVILREPRLANHLRPQDGRLVRVSSRIQRIQVATPEHCFTASGPTWTHSRRARVRVWRTTATPWLTPPSARARPRCAKTWPRRSIGRMRDGAMTADYPLLCRGAIAGRSSVTYCDS